MKRSNEEGTRARYENALRHDGREAATRVAPARHVSRRQAEQRDHEELRSVSGANSGFARASDTVGSSEPNRRAPDRRDSPASLRPTDVQDLGAARLAQSRQRKSQQKMRATTLLLVLPTAVASLMLMATAHVVFRDWRSYETEARIATAQRDALREQLDAGQRRLRSLRSVKGREQILAEHGFIRPGDRLLLFPEENSPEVSAARSSNDISNDIAARRAEHHAAPSSAWARAARTMTGWLSSLSGRDSAPASTSSEHKAQAPASDADADDGNVSPEDRIVRPSDGSAEGASGGSAR